uniref:Uncharacterized protein n=1 Tax=Glycine max TaxID=3847 RepID=A0A0R0JPH3_SOYBN
MPPTVVLVPPLFDFPPLAARNRMLHPIYDVVFGKLAITSLFQDYFHQARHLTTRIMLKPIDNPHVDVIATPEESIAGDALFRWQSDVNDPHTLMDLYVSTSDPFTLWARRKNYTDFSPLEIFLRITTSVFSTGYFKIFFNSFGFSMAHMLNFGNAKLTNLMNWSCAMGYGVGSGSPLCPSFNFNLEIFIASFYQHMAVQRRVKNPLEENSVVGITNYIDFGFELQTWYSFYPTFQIGASWQANKNFMLKAKVGPSSSSMALAFKSWWKPSFTFSISM